MGGGTLLCTDVAARGLDVAGVDWVVQFDPPVDPAQYVHRVGRTARAGVEGRSLLFLSDREESYVDFLRTRGVPIEALGVGEECSPPVDPVEEEAEEQKGGGEVAEDGADEMGQEEEKKDEVVIVRSATGKNLPDVLPKVRSWSMKDRDLLEKGTRAYTSYVRAYKEHHCAFIFR